MLKCRKINRRLNEKILIAQTMFYTYCSELEYVELCLSNLSIYQLFMLQRNEIIKKKANFAT
jgi:hypothetical protein